METSGNTVLITGGGTGIGLALAEALAERGNEVIICGRRRLKLQSAKARIPGLHFRVCDVSKPRSRQALVRWAKSRFKSLNVLVNNAGVQRPVNLCKGERDLPDADEEIAVNLAAPLHLASLLIPYFRRRKRAAIINVSSGLAFTPLAVVPVYCATKAAIHSLSLSMRHQLEGTPVRVFEIILPMVATALSGTRARPEDKFVMSAEDAARGIVEAVESDTYEAALGAAVNLRERREALFPMINH